MKGTVFLSTPMVWSNTTWINIRHEKKKCLFFYEPSPITLQQQKWKSSKSNVSRPVLSSVLRLLKKVCENWSKQTWVIVRNVKKCHSLFYIQSSITLQSQNEEWLRNKSWKTDCVLSFNMGLKLKTHELFWFWYA